MLIMKLGQKVVDKESGTVYIIQSTKEGNVVLVSEDGEVSMRIHKDSIVLSGFEPVHD